MVEYDKMHSFCFNRDLLKIKSSIFSPNFMGCEEMLQIQDIVLKKLYKFQKKNF